MMRMAVVTSTRAEYGLLAPVVRELRKFEGPDFKVALVVTGTHLSADYGMTVEEIRADGVRVDAEVPIPVASATASDTSRNQAAALGAFAELLERERYDAVLLLGDRYEMLAVAIAASNALIPVFHMCGGDVTEGAVDDCIRHSITKMSYLHFPTNPDSARRIVQLGESPERVFAYGSTSIDNMLDAATMEREEALASIGLEDSKYALCTFHPVTLEEGGVEEQVGELVSAMAAYPDIRFVVTKANSDRGGALVNDLLDDASRRVENISVFASLGARRYLSLMRNALFVLGNSSSGIIEAPALRVPTVNVGDRQRGRLRAASIIDCSPDATSIKAAIDKAVAPAFRKACAKCDSPYGSDRAAPSIAQKCFEALLSGIDLKKAFRDIVWQEGLLA